MNDRPTRSFGRPDKPEPEPVVLLPTVRMPSVRLPVVLELDPAGLAEASATIQAMVADAVRSGFEQAMTGMEMDYGQGGLDDGPDISEQPRVDESAGAAAVP